MGGRVDGWMGGWMHACICMNQAIDEPIDRLNGWLGDWPETEMTEITDRLSD